MILKIPKFDEISFNSFKIIFIKGIGILFTYALTLFLTNNFSDEHVGEFSFANNILLVFGTICLFGANQSLYQFGGLIKENTDSSYLKNLYFKYLTISFVVFTVLIIVALTTPESLFEIIFNKKNASAIVLKTIAFVFIYAWATLNFEMLRILNKIQTSEFFRSIFRTVYFFISALIIYSLHLNYLLVDVFLLSFAVTAIISSVIIFISFKSNKTLNLVKCPDLSYKKILKVSFPMAISALAMMLMQSIDSFFIIKYHTYADLAYYSIALRLTVLISIVLTSINTIIAPEIAKNYFNNEFENLKSIIYKSCRLNFLLTIPFLIILLFFPTFILSLFGTNYIEAKTAIIILCLGQFVSSFCGSVGLYLNMTGRQKQFLLLLFLALGLNFILNFSLIPNYGIEGAAISSSVSLIFWNIVGAIYIYNKDQIKTFFRI